MHKLEEFRPITLEELKGRAELMQRTDNKYILHQPQLASLLEALKQDFDVLQIGDLTSFAYSSAYWDTARLDTYQDHNKGRRRRFKIRFRHYKDHDLYFFEIKIKGSRNATHKYRVVSDRQSYAATQLPEHLQQFCQEKLVQHYSAGLQESLQPSVRVDYQRTTLVARHDVQRITIDTRVEFHAGERCHALPADRYIVEIKSVTGRSPTDRWLQQNGIRPVSRCSKYSMGVNLLLQPGTNSVFAPVLRRKFNLSVLERYEN